MEGTRKKVTPSAMFSRGRRGKAKKLKNPEMIWKGL